MCSPDCLPTPEFLLLDEVHLAGAAIQTCLGAWPTTPVVGPTGTLDELALAQLARILDLDTRVLQGAVVRVPDSVRTNPYPQVKFHFREVCVTSLETTAYAAGARWMNNERLLRLLIVSSDEREGGQASNYDAVIWKGITRQLAEANQTILEDLVQVLVRCPSPRTFLVEISERLGAEKTIGIMRRTIAAATPLSHSSMPETGARLGAIWERRGNIIGGCTFLPGELKRLTGSEIVDCLICYDATSDFLFASCGHSVCSACCCKFTNKRCPVCRSEVPGWRPIADLQVSVQREEDPERKALSDASSKLCALIGILKDSEPSSRALVVCPALKWLMHRVASELERAGVIVSHPWGPANDQVRVSRRWERGAYDGLLRDTDVLGVSLSAASKVIFLSPLISPQSFRQAASRVVRQGNEAVEKDIPVEIIMLACKDNSKTVPVEDGVDARDAEDRVGYVSNDGPRSGWILRDV